MNVVENMVLNVPQTENFIDALNIIGKDGWEPWGLSRSVNPDTNEPMYQIFLKRTRSVILASDGVPISRRPT